MGQQIRGWSGFYHSLLKRAAVSGSARAYCKNWDRGIIYNLNSLIEGSATVSSILGFNDRGVALASIRKAGASATSYALLIPKSGAEITVDPSRSLKFGETAVATITVIHTDDTPFTYTFPDGLFVADPEDALELKFLEPVPPFTLSTEDPKREFTVRFTATKRAFATLSTRVVTEGPESETFEAE